MLIISVILIVSIVLPAIFDEGNKDTVMNEFCNNECISRQNRKHSFCC